MILAAVLAAVLVLVIAFAVVRLRRETRRAEAAEAEQARLVAELQQREREVTELTPFRTLVEGVPDWIWSADAGGTLTYTNPAGAAALDVGMTVESPGWAGVLRRGERLVDTRSVRTDDGWLGVDRDLTEPVAPPRVSVVRRPVVDGRREVVGYELLGDGSVLAAFTPDALVALGGGRPVWLTLDGEVAPELLAHAPVIQVTADASHERAQALLASGFALALDGYEGPTPLLDLCATVKVRADGRSDEELQALIAEPAQRGLTLVATNVDSADEFTRCRVLGFSHFQGGFFARPRGATDGRDTGALASIHALGELTSGDASFEDLERIIGADVGLSIALLRHVNSSFFALPRRIDSVREALTLLGTRAVRRWATVVALSSVAGAPDQLIALALLRARMCELLGGDGEEDRDRLFTVGLFSVADALLDTPMSEVLASLPLSEEITGALLRHEGRSGRILGTVLRYEQGRFPSEGDPAELAEAYLEALRWADDAGRMMA